MDHLINKFLSGSLTKEESQQLELWLEKDIKNRVEFENIVAHLNHQDTEIEATKARVFNKVISTKSDLKDSRLTNRQKLQYILKVAAVFIIVFGSILMLIQPNYLLNTQSEVTQNHAASQIEKETAYGQQLSFKLPDGTMVKLNAGSKLIYPKNFTDQSREVTLIGEGYFDVKRDEKRPFPIQANNINIRVLGTSFNVRSYSDEDNISVGVRSGLVSVSSLNGDQEMLLHENDLANYSSKTDKLQKDIIDESALVFGWIDRELVLKDYTIDQILVELSRWYNVEFKLEGKLDMSRKFTTRYNDPTLKSVLESLSYVYEFNYEINEKTVTLK